MSVDEQLFSVVLERGSLGEVISLVEEGANINYVSSIYGVPVLVQAAQNGMVDVVDYLLSQGADIEQKYEAFGYSPLAAAVEQAQLPVVALLINRGARLDSRDRWGNSLIQIASSSDYAVDEIVDLLKYPEHATYYDFSKAYVRDE